MHLTALVLVLASLVHHQIEFRDIAPATGLAEVLHGLRCHSAAWGDLDGDGSPELFVGTFPVPDRFSKLLRFRNGRFVAVPCPPLERHLRPTGVVFADLDSDGDLDLYVASMPASPESGLACRLGSPVHGCLLLRNQRGQLADVSDISGACPHTIGGRSVAVLDYDADGLLDLIVGEDPFPGYSGSRTAKTWLFHNDGDLRFSDRSDLLGGARQSPALGAISADFDDDGWPDVFLAAGEDTNRLLLNDHGTGFREATWLADVLRWPGARGENMVCGVAAGDVNRDGRLDIVLGPHFSTPWMDPVPVRLFLNRGIVDDHLQLQEVTGEAGLVPLRLKAPHVEIRDLDNDGWPDILTSFVKFSGGKAFPVVFRNTGTGPDGLPHFEPLGLDANDFPPPELRVLRRSGDFFAAMVRSRSAMYAACAPTADLDRDGRLDCFVGSWWPELPSLLLQNISDSGSYLQVRLEARGPLNRQGIGCRVEAYRHGTRELLAVSEITPVNGYASVQEAVAHLGLGSERTVDVRIRLPYGLGDRWLRGVRANQGITATVQAHQ